MRSNLEIPQRVQRGYLAEPYDGIGQYVLVTMARSSTSAAYKAKIAAGDFGGSRTFPAGTPVPVFSVRGRLEVLLGNIPDRCIIDHFRRTEGAVTFEGFDRAATAEGLGMSPFGLEWPSLGGGARYQIATVGNILTNSVAKWPTNSSPATISSTTTLGWDEVAIAPLPLPFTGSFPVEMLVKWRFVGTNPGGTHRLSLSVRIFDETDNEWMGGTYQRDFVGGSDFSDLMATTGSGETQITAPVAALLGSETNTSNYLWMRVRSDGSTVSVKVWRTNVSEPGSFQVTRAHGSSFVPHHLTLSCSRNTGNLSVNIDSIQFTEGMGDANRSWGTGPLGSWLKASEFGDIDPAFDELAWVDGEYGWMQYTGLEDPTMGLRLAPEPVPPHGDPAGLPSTQYWPLNLDYRVEFPEGHTSGYLQTYFGPTHHTHLNAWLPVTTQWYGDPENYGIEADIGHQGWAQWPIALDETYGNVWFVDNIASTLEEVLQNGLRVKVRADNTGHFAKAWVDGTPEPGWQIKVYWDPNDPMYSRIREFYRVFYFEQQTGESFAMDWVRICP